MDGARGLEHHPAQLEVGLTGLDLQRAARVALEVADLLRLGVGPRPALAVTDDVPERHQMRPAVAADRRAGERPLLLEEGDDLRLGHRDLAALAHPREATQV